MKKRRRVKQLKTGVPSGVKEEDVLSIRKAKKRLKDLDENDLIPIEEAFRKAGWGV